MWVYFSALKQMGNVCFKFTHLSEKYSASLDFFIGKKHGKISFKSKTSFCSFLEGNFQADEWAGDPQKKSHHVISCPAGRGSNTPMPQTTYPGKPQSHWAWKRPPRAWSPASPPALPCSLLKNIPTATSTWFWTLPGIMVPYPKHCCAQLCTSTLLSATSTQ